MNSARLRCVLACGVALVCQMIAVARGNAQVNVLTYHNDNARTGQNLQETILTPANVNRTQFGRLFTQSVDGYVYAQPLYVSNVVVPNKGTHNVVYVATERDSVYAFDADDRVGSNASPLWQVSFVNARARVNPVPARDAGANDIVPQIGITGTPVIDGTSGTLYVVANTKEYQGRSHAYVYRLHALDIATGAEKFGGPVVITASVPGTGDGGTTDILDPLRHLQRPGLLLANGIVYIAFGSHGDVGTYHGWLIAYDATTLQQLGVYNTTPNGAQGAIWQSGAGPAADANGDIYFETGNGDFDANTGGGDYGDSLVKLTGGGVLTVADYFTPFDQAALNQADQDFGSGAPLLLPDEPGAHPHLAVGCGKEGTIYLIDRDNMGQFNNNGISDNQIVQSIPTAVGGTWSMPAYWNAGGTELVYFLGTGDVLKAFQLSNGQLSVSPVSQSNQAFGFPGSTPSISANGATNGIVWVLQVNTFSGRDASYPRGPAVACVRCHGRVARVVQQRTSRPPGPRRQRSQIHRPHCGQRQSLRGQQRRLSVFGLL